MKGKYEISSEDMATIELAVVHSIREALTHLMFVEEKKFRAFISSVRGRRTFNCTLHMRNPPETLEIRLRSSYIEETGSDG